MPTVDGLYQFTEWYATLDVEEVDSMIAPLNDIIDAAIINCEAASTFLPLVS